MTSPAELRAVCEALSRPPFSRQLSVIGLHDDLAHPDLVALINEVVAYLDGTKTHDVDIRNEYPEVTSARLAAFLKQMAKFEFDDMNENMFAEKLLKGDNRAFLLKALYFLLHDIDACRKTIYLSRYMNPPAVPPEYATEESIHPLLEQYSAYQDEFQALYDQSEQMRQSSAEINAMKREIQQMEEEKQMLITKLQRSQNRVQDMPQRDKWLGAARSLRLEQQRQRELSDRLKEQKNLASQAEQKGYTLQQKLKEAKDAANLGPEALLQRLKEESTANKYLAEEKLSKDVQETEQKLSSLQRVFAEPISTQQDLVKHEERLQELNRAIKTLSEKRMTSHGSDEKLTLLKQQASIISNKKDTAATRLGNCMNRNQELLAEVARKTDAVNASASSKIPKGEEFKNYVAQLRVKSTQYKAKKAELTELSTEENIVSHTLEVSGNRNDDFLGDLVLRAREKQATELLEKIERKSGVSGFTNAQETLERVSEKKSELDEAKEATMTDVSAIVQKIVQTINEKKLVLAPHIQELRSLRQRHAEVEALHVQKKAAYDSVMLNLDAETQKLETEIKVVQNEISTDQSRWHYVSSMCELADISMDRVLQEMKAYIGGDSELETLQRQRGFKTYRDLYHKKINDIELQVRNLREQQKEIKDQHEEKMQQQAMFASLKRLLVAKMESNKRAAASMGAGSDDMFSSQGQDRLVIS
ncbi:hypothetical protein RI367_001726 [Sorochytrium milnesiophthora]